MSNCKKHHLFPSNYILTGLSISVFVLVSCSSPAHNATSPGPGVITTLQTAYGVQHARVFTDNDTASASLLVVLLHGDSPNGAPDYQYIFAEELAMRISGIAVAALLRPGYSDPSGLRSAGRRGFTTGDNYTVRQLNTISQAIRELQDQYNARKIVLIGHSGGAAIAANLMGLETNVAQSAVLLSCPCDLDLWRKHMKDTYGSLLWRLPVRSISPLSVVEDIPIRTHIRLFVGADDPVTPPDLSRVYTEALKERGLDAEWNILPGRGHEILNDDAVLNHVENMIEKELGKEH